VTVSAHLRAHGLLDTAGGTAYLARLLDAVPTAVSAERYAGIVRDAARRRDLQALGCRLVADAAEGTHVGEVVAAAQEALSQFTHYEATDAIQAMRCADFLAAELPTPLWIVDKLAPGGGLTFLFGRAGTGKSFIAFELARCVATRQHFLGEFLTVSGPAIYFNLEMSSSQFQHRLRMLETHHPVGDGALYVVNEPLALNDAACFTRFKALCDSTAPALVVIDPLVRALPGVDENSASEVNQALTPVADLAREMGFALLVVHHATKGAARDGLDSLAGSRDFAARADVALLVQTPQPGDGGGERDDSLRRVTLVKSRWTSAVPPFCFRVSSDPQGSPLVVAAEMPNACDEVLDLLRIKSPLAAKDIVAELEGVKSRDQVHRALSTLLKKGHLCRPSRGLYAIVDGG